MRTKTILYAFVVGSLFLCEGAVAGEAGYRWVLSYQDLGTKSLVLSDTSEKVTLKSGWQCEVGATSQGGNYQSRKTICRKNDDELSFVVQ